MANQKSDQTMQTSGALETGVKSTEAGVHGHVRQPRRATGRDYFNPLP